MIAFPAPDLLFACAAVLTAVASLASAVAALITALSSRPPDGSPPHAPSHVGARPRLRS